MALSLAIFGGSFDPPHLGHLAFARAAFAALQPDRLVWLPAGRPWQKPDQALAPAEHRLAMLGLLLSDDAGFEVDARELHRLGPSFSVHTLSELHAEHPGAGLLFLLGQDQYSRLHTWFQVERVLELATLVVVPRAGLGVEAPPGLPPHRMVALELPEIPISSTAVRDAIKHGGDIRPLVGNEVASYIASHRLYEKH